MYFKLCLIAAFFLVLVGSVNARDDVHPDCWTFYESQSCAEFIGPWQSDKECSGCHPVTHFCADHTGWDTSDESGYNSMRYYADLVESIFDWGFENYTPSPFHCVTMWGCDAYCVQDPGSNPVVWVCKKDVPTIKDFSVTDDLFDTPCE